MALCLRRPHSPWARFCRGKGDMASTADRTTYESEMEAYFREGHDRAMALPNRGPLRFAADGRLTSDISEAYERFGFYVFEGFIKPRELAEIEASFMDMVDRLPVGPGAEL